MSAAPETPAVSPAPAIDSRAFRNALGSFATGITVMTAVGADGVPVGITVNSFSSLSLDPPLVLFCVARSSQSLAAFSSAPGFAVNVLADDQQELSVRFSRRDLQDRWGGLAVDTWDTGAPILKGCLAVLECDRHDLLDGGDHVIVVGRVRRLESRADGRPLLYFRGAYATVG